MPLKSLLARVFLGVLINFLVILFALKKWAQWHASMEFDLARPPVSFLILRDIQNPKQAFYANRWLCCINRLRGLFS
ncbi:MAG: hypothetical protein ACI8YI_000499 [Paracoccaceae bacterium]|jgi:hypothetical protein